MANVLFVIPSFEFGGTNTSLMSIISAFKNECKISIFAISNQGEFKDKFSEVGQIKTSGILSLWYGNFKEMGLKDKILATVIKIIKRASRAFDYDIENLLLKYIAKDNRFRGYDSVIGFQEGNATRLAALIPSNKHISWIHCNLKYSGINHKRQLLSYRHSDAVVCVSQSGKRAFDEIYPELKNKSMVIYNLINRNHIIDLSRAVDTDAQSINKDVFTIISIGRFHPIKQFGKIPEIAAKIKAKNNQIKWLIIGDGDESEKQNLLSEIQKWGVEAEVIMTGFKNNPYPLLAKADLYVCTSLSEACPMVFLEANVFGKQVVSNDFPSAHELLTENTGSICSLDQMPEVISRYISNRCKEIVPDLGFQDKSLRILTSLFVEK